MRRRAACVACKQEVELQRLGLADLPGGTATRLVHHNTELGHPRTFATNSVTTAKYNVATFLPRFLFEVFSQVAYFYFLVQVRILTWPPGAYPRSHFDSLCLVPSRCLCVVCTRKVPSCSTCYQNPQAFAPRKNLCCVCK